MSHMNNSICSKQDSEGKNTDIVLCTYCPSKILNPGVGTFITIEFPLPFMMCKSDEDINKKEPICDYWLIEDITNFENIGVSHKVDNVKYLTCADCERGPVGWQDLSTFRSYIALSRVKYQKLKP